MGWGRVLETTGSDLRMIRNVARETSGAALPCFALCVFWPALGDVQVRRWRGARRVATEKKDGGGV